MRLFLVTASFISCLSLLSCRNNEITPLPAGVELPLLESISIPNNCATNLIIIDSLLLISQDCSEKCFSVYRTNSLEFVMEWGAKGNSPGELGLPLVLKNASYKIDSLYLYDLHRLKINQIDLSAVLDGQNDYSVIRNDEMDIPNKLCNTLNLSVVSSSIIAGSDIIGADPNSKMFFLYNLADSSKTQIDFYRSYSFRNKETLRFAYSNSIYANEKKGIIGIGFRHFDMVNFYDLTGNLLRSHHFSRLIKPHGARAYSAIDNNYPIFFSYAYGTEEYFYIRRICISLDDLIKKTPFELNILRFTWDGDLCGVYSVDPKISAFCVDEKQQKLFAVTNVGDSEYAQLLVYSLIKD